MSSTAERTEKKVKRVSRLGPRLKNGGGEYSIRQLQASATNARGAVKQKTCGAVCGAHRVARTIWVTAGPALSVAREDAAELVHLVQSLARAAHHACQRIVCDDHREAGFFHEQTIDIA